ncbi:MAG TPA: TonB-dependent receptor, partial [Arenimonas sp.]|nr:TonB-dependent receptor [Arenimonas sp.]
MKRSALSVALGMCFAAGVQAQSNTAGAVVVQASAGDVVVIENPATGFKREVTVGADGSIRVPSLQIGTYTIKRGGDSRIVNISVGTATAVSFAGAASASTLEAIEVRGVVNPIDVSSVESNTILTKQQIDSLPVARNVTNVALLAPGTTAGDSDFGNFASFGGSSVSENAYYINGFNVTNFRTGLGFSNVPFDMYQEFQVKTGGYGAEFGRSTGGVINAVTKRGSNEWHFGVNAFWEPDTSENGPDVFWQNPTDADGNPRDPLVRSVRSRDSVENFTANVYASGPIVEDRLFFYAIAQQRDLKTDNFTANTLEKIRNDDPFYGLKLDWAITDDHYLEYTGFRDRSDETTEVFQYDYNNDEIGASGGGGAFVSAGGDNHILKYTGYLTDTFTLSALAGRGTMSQTAGSPADLCPAIYDGRAGGLVALGCWNEAAFTVESGEDERTAYRLDGEWILGDHQLRFGLDREETVSQSTLQYSGGIYYRYYNVPASG